MSHVKDGLLCVFLLALIVLIGREYRTVHDVLWNVRSATWNVSETSRVLKDNSQATLTEEKKILGETSEFIKLTNLQLYGKSGHPGLIPRTSQLVEKAFPVMDNLAAATAKLNTAISDLDALINSGKATVEGVTTSEHRIEQLIADVDAQVTNPDIKGILTQMLEAAKNGAKATQEFAATTTDVRQIADKARETYLKPVNLWWGLVKELLPLAGSAAQVVK